MILYQILKMQNNKPLVSVIIATYNRSNILNYTISTVLNQNYQNFEILVVGDHCTDNTEQIVFSFNDPRIKFFNLPENFGEQSYPNNFGFEQSKGDYIAWLNHDDLWYPEHLDLLITEIEQAKADIAYSWYFPFGVSTLNLPIYTKEPQYNVHLTIPASTWLTTRQTILEVGLWKSATSMYNIPSQEWISRAFKAGKKLKAVPKCTVIAIQSGSRKNSYKERQHAEHDYVYRNMYTNTFREQILTTLCQNLAYRFNEISLEGILNYNTKKIIIYFAIKFKFSLFGILNFVRFKKKGGHINKLRLIRGLHKLK